MILVLLGTQNNSFNRLLKEIDRLAKKQIIKDEIVVQSGYTKYKSEYMKILDFIGQDELDEYEKNADLIITHGGVGSIMGALKKEKKVIAVPRLHKYNEHVNDHQKQIIENFSDKGYIIGIKNVDELEDAIEKSKRFVPIKYKTTKDENKKILKIIEKFIDDID